MTTSFNVAITIIQIVISLLVLGSRFKKSFEGFSGELLIGLIIKKTINQKHFVIKVQISRLKIIEVYDNIMLFFNLIVCKFWLINHFMIKIHF